jgi:hypothetical protein
MNQLLQLIHRFQYLPVSDMVRETIEENASIIEAKQISQLDAGLYPDGGPILPEYIDFTIEIKKIKGQPYDKVTLHDTGNFYRGIKLDLESDSFTLDSSDSKTGDLVDKYGEVFGLSEQSKQELIDEQFIPTMESKIKNYLQIA